MTQSFARSATATFAINGTDQEVTVKNVPYIWIPATNPDMDSEGAFAVRDWMRANNVAAHRGTSLICVTTSPT